MAKDSSVEQYMRFLDKRYKAFREDINKFITSLTQGDITEKKQTAAYLISAIDRLKDAMSFADQPRWITPFAAHIQEYLNNAGKNQNAGLKIIYAIMKFMPDIESEEWDFGSSSANSGIDFDSIYQEHYHASKVPDLFDTLVGQLETIIDGGGIDSVQTTKALEKLIATIKKNARGDYFSILTTREFIHLFCRKYFTEVLESTPGVGPLVKAFRKTVSELDTEIVQVKGNIHKQLVESAKVDLQFLEYEPIALPAPVKDTLENIGE